MAGKDLMKFPHVWRGRLSGEDVEGKGAEGEDIADFVAEIAIADGFGCDVDERGFLDPILEVQGERRALSGLGGGTYDTAGLPVENLELRLGGLCAGDQDGLRSEGTVDDAARNAIVTAGYGPDYKFFTHRLGHGIGLDEHEHPYLVRGSKTVLAAGMTFSNEPGVYVPGEFGMRCEDVMVIVKDGAAELLTPGFQPSLDKPLG